MGRRGKKTPSDLFSGGDRYTNRSWTPQWPSYTLRFRFSTRVSKNWMTFSKKKKYLALFKTFQKQNPRMRAFSFRTNNNDKRRRKKITVILRITAGTRILHVKPISLIETARRVMTSSLIHIEKWPATTQSRRYYFFLSKISFDFSNCQRKGFLSTGQTACFFSSFFFFRSTVRSRAILLLYC